MPSQGCLEIGKLHKCKFKTWPDKLCLLVPLIIFYSHFTAISKNFTTSFVNYISIKIPLRSRYNNAVFVILLQQRKAHFLLTANAQHIETWGGGVGGGSLLLRISQMKKDIFFSSAVGEKNNQRLNQAISGRIRPELRHSYSFSSSIAATKSNKLSFTSNFATQI